MCPMCITVLLARLNAEVMGCSHSCVVERVSTGLGTARLGSARLGSARPGSARQAAKSMETVTVDGKLIPLKNERLRCATHRNKLLRCLAAEQTQTTQRTHNTTRARAQACAR